MKECQREAAMERKIAVLLLLLTGLCSCRSSWRVFTENQNGRVNMEINPIEMESLFEKQLAEAARLLDEGAFIQALKLLESVDPEVLESTSQKLADRFFRLSCNLLFRKGEWSALNRQISCALARLHPALHTQYRLFHARACFLQNKRKKAWRIYSRLMKHDLFLFSTEDILIACQLMSDFLPDFNLKQWLEFCRSCRGYEAEIQTRLIEFLIDKDEQKEAFALWLEMRLYQVQKGQLLPEEVSNPLTVPQPFLDMEDVSRFLEWLGGGGIGCIRIESDLESLPPGGFRELLNLFAAVETEGDPASLLFKLGEMEHSYSEFPQYSLYTARLIARLDTENRSGLWFPLMDRALGQAARGPLREIIALELKKRLALEEGEERQLLSTSEMQNLTRRMLNGASPALATALVNMAALKAGHLSGFALRELGRLNSRPAIRDYLSLIYSEGGEQ